MTPHLVDLGMIHQKKRGFLSQSPVYSYYVVLYSVRGICDYIFFGSKASKQRSCPEKLNRASLRCVFVHLVNPFVFHVGLCVWLDDERSKAPLDGGHFERVVAFNTPKPYMDMKVYERVRRNKPFPRKRIRKLYINFRP